MNPALLAALLTLLPCAFATAQETPAEPAAPQPPAVSEPVPDLMRGPVDPYIVGTQRGKFMNASGVDSELEEKEFSPAAAFAQPFDSWAAMRPFDRNHDERIDWQEFNAYRLTIRKAVVRTYDKDGNRKLEGEERDAANRDLAAGKLPLLTPGDESASDPTGENNIQIQMGAGQNQNGFNMMFGGQPGQPGQLPPQLVQWLDKDADGEVSQAERIAAYKEVRTRGWEALNREFDKDGDGVLSDEEKAAMPSPARFVMKLDALGMRDFDENQDGQLDDTEYAAIDEYFGKWMKVGQENMMKQLDLDKDGTISPEENAAMQAKAQAIMFQMLPKAMSWADANADGMASPEEWMGLFDRFSNSFDGQADKYTKKFDADGNGRLSAPERDALMDGLMQEDRDRQARFDADGDGILNANETIAAIEDALTEWGVKPAGK